MKKITKVKSKSNGASEWSMHGPIKTVYTDVTYTLPKRPHGVISQVYISNADDQSDNSES